MTANFEPTDLGNPRIFDLLRENRSVMLSLRDSEQNVVDLKLEISKLENGHLELGKV